MRHPSIFYPRKVQSWRTPPADKKSHIVRRGQFWELTTAKGYVHLLADWSLAMNWAIAENPYTINEIRNAVTTER